MRKLMALAVLGLVLCGCTPESAKQLNEQNRESLKNLIQRVEQDLVPAVQAMTANAAALGIWLGAPKVPLAPVVDAQGQTSQAGLDQSAAARKQLQAAIDAREWWKGVAIAGLSALLGALGIGAPWLARIRAALAAARTIAEEKGVQVTALVKGAQDIIAIAKDKGPVSAETAKAALSGWQAFMGVKDSLAGEVKQVKAEWSAAENRAV
ncbi:MAG: hypothetical protein WC789_09295 [Lentisphaeria bacterium]